MNENSSSSIRKGATTYVLWNGRPLMNHRWVGTMTQIASVRGTRTRWMPGLWCVCTQTTKPKKGKGQKLDNLVCSSTRNLYCHAKRSGVTHNKKDGFAELIIEIQKYKKSIKSRQPSNMCVRITGWWENMGKTKLAKILRNTCVSSCFVLRILRGQTLYHDKIFFLTTLHVSATLIHVP